MTIPASNTHPEADDLEPAVTLPRASARVVENAVDLVRAEARLALCHAHRTARIAISALLLVVLGASLLQLTVLSVALVPLLDRWLEPTTIVGIVLIPLIATGTTLLLAYGVWRRVERPPGSEQVGTQEVVQ